jgi:hypothetical protein
MAMSGGEVIEFDFRLAHLTAEEELRLALAHISGRWSFSVLNQVAPDPYASANYSEQSRVSISGSAAFMGAP